MSWAVGIDTGGTFTDLAAVNRDTGARYVTKVVSSPANPADAVLEALRTFARECQCSITDVSFFGHGTTVGTNAVLEGKGARTGLLLTEGYGAIYEVRGGIRPNRTDLVDPRYQKQKPLIPLHLTRYVAERTSFDGSILRPIDEASVRRSVRELGDEKVEAIAVLCLFSFMNAAHEERIAEIVAQEYPGCRVSLSSRVLPVIREYVRLSTTALDAYVGPVVTRYLETLERRLVSEGLSTQQSYVMQSNGGLMRITLGSQYANEILLSGPAAGVAFGLRLGSQIGESNLLTLDMGGTSTDISVIQDGQVAQTREGRIAGQEIGTPMIEIHTLGAGGGTVAWVGKDGLLKVGPQSAGADPGPACYGRGGREPTVTDADVVLGYLDARRFLGGRMPGRPELAHDALARIGAPFGMTAVEAARGVHRIVNTHMAVDLRLTLEMKGCDPGRFTLVAVGGAGPTHACWLAEDVGIQRILVPPYPGIACAVGLLQTDVVHVYMQSYLVRIDRAPIGDINERFQKLAGRALEDAALEGFRPDEVMLNRQIDIRYPHQGYELALDCQPGTLAERDVARLRREFDRLHERVYGVSAPDEPVEIVNLRIRSVVAKEPLGQIRASLDGATVPVKLGEREAYFDSVGGFVRIPVYERSMCHPGARVDGPAIIEQLDTTTVIGPEWEGRVDAFHNLAIARRMSGDRRGS